MVLARPRLRVSVWTLFLPIALSSAALPALARETVEIRVADEAVVTRGDFIRAAVQAFEVDVGAAAGDVLPYRRVPNALLPYVRAAHSRGALELFGTDLLLAQGITRGEALQVAVLLGGLKPAENFELFYKDVRKGSSLEQAVAVALEQTWMDPVNSTIFGSRRMLQGKEANLLIRKIRGENLPAEGHDGSGDEMAPVPTIKVNFGTSGRPLPKSEILETLWQIVNEEYLYDEKINPDEAAYSAAEAMMKTLGDPYSTFMRPVDSRSFQTQIRGEVSGIGAQVDYKDGYLTIVSPIRGGPAEAAGLKPGDQVLSVDGFNIVNIGFLEAVEKVRGPKGSKAKLHIRRDGIEFDIVVTRDLIKVPEIEVSWQGEVAVIKLVQFGRVTHDELRAEVVKINAQNPKGFILDLRSNPGGLLDAATSVMGNFVTKGSVVAQIAARNSTRFEKTTDDPSLDAGVPMIVLINGGSASASEIVAGALQDHKRATLVGEKTFGKGTVQQVLQFNDQSAFKMTIAEWFTPDGRKIDGVGVQPDVAVPEGERDDQMSRALELLRR